MTTEQDSKRRRPPTIDLTATEVSADAADAAAAEGSASAKPGAANAARPPRHFGRFMASAAAGAIVVLAIGAGLWAAGLLPPRERAASVSIGPVTNTETLDELSARLAKVEGALAAPRPEPAPRPDPAAAARMAAAEAETKSLAETVAGLARRIDDATSAARDARSRADAAAAAAAAADQKAASAGQNRVERGDLDALANRIAALERSTTAMSDELAKLTATTGDRAARLVVAAEALRAAVERGDPFANELDAVKALGADPSKLAPLAPFAAEGVPSTAALAHELAALTPAMMPAAETPPSTNGFLEKLQANAEKLVRIRPIDAPRGSDAAAIVARVKADAARVDIAGALAEIATLPEEARAPAAAWVKKVEARSAAIAAGRRIVSDALAALGKPAAQ